MSFDFEPADASATVTFPGGQMTVRGLSLPDVSVLVALHRDLISDLFQRAASDPAQALTAAAVFGQRLLHESPELAADIIALAADVPGEKRPAVSRVPFPAQLEALEKIAELTFRTEQDLKKVIETVVRGARAISGSLGSLQTLPT